MFRLRGGDRLGAMQSKSLVLFTLGGAETHEMRHVDIDSHDGLLDFILVAGHGI